MLRRIRKNPDLMTMAGLSPVSRVNSILSMLFCMCVGLTILSPSPSFAACTSPDGVAGSLDYDDSIKTQKICDGTTWKVLKEIDYSTGTGARIGAQISNDAGTCTAIKTGRIRYDGTNVWEYCNGSTWTPFDQACAGPASCPDIGNVCTDGSVFIGCPIPNYFRTYAARCDVGMSGATCGTGSRTSATWATQTTNCNNLTQHSQTDWYLPNRTELWQIYAHSSAINYFGTGTSYWTSEAVGYYGSAVNAWYLGTDGLSQTGARTTTRPARCIRNESGCSALGDVCADGTIYAGNYNGTQIYIADTDAPTTLAWGPTGATGMGYCDTAPYLGGSCDRGRENTQLLAGLAGTYAAADYCAALNAHGYSTGWYLPSFNELNVAYLNLKAGQPAGTFNFQNAYYWSSTEASSSAAGYQDFNAGFQGNPTKTNAYRVRCMRR